MGSTSDRQGEIMHKVKTKLMLFCFAMLLLTAITGLLVFWDNENDVVNYYPHKLLEACPRLPISHSEQTNGVVAKYEIGNVQVDTLMEWYKNRGFSTVADSSQTNGYGANGISFTILTLNRALTLVITHWKDS